MKGRWTRFDVRARHVWGLAALGLAWAVATVIGGRPGEAPADAERRAGRAQAPAPPAAAYPLRAARTPPVAEKQRPEDGAELAPPLLEAPVLGLRLEVLRNNFGEARGPRRHEGVDILAPGGTPVLAAVDGWVWQMKWDDRGGRTLHLLETSGRYILLYAHLDAYAEGLARGRPVRRGEVLGYVGETGNASGSPHLHLRLGRIRSAERWWDDVPLDPYPLLVEALGR